MNNWTKMGVAGLAISQLFSCAIGMDENQEKEKSNTIQATDFSIEATDMIAKKMRDYKPSSIIKIDPTDLTAKKMRDYKPTSSTSTQK